MKVNIVQEVSYDGGKIGRTWRNIVCEPGEATARILELLTKPREFYDHKTKKQTLVKEYVRHVHREPDWEPIIGYLCDGIFVFITETTVSER